MQIHLDNDINEAISPPSSPDAGQLKWRTGGKTIAQIGYMTLHKCGIFPGEINEK
jgi:hypothetical protein